MNYNHANVKALMNGEQCRRIYSQSKVTDHMLYAETNSDRGTGEGGGGWLVVKPDRTGLPYIQIGIESWGDDDDDGFRRVFTRLTSLMSWVYQVWATELCYQVAWTIEH